jgi:hypothetical protein
MLRIQSPTLQPIHTSFSDSFTKEGRRQLHEEPEIPHEFPPEMPPETPPEETPLPEPDTVPEEIPPEIPEQPPQREIDFLSFYLQNIFSNVPVLLWAKES